jgi:filamentous hemagglutinin
MTLITNKGTTTPLRTGAVYVLFERNGAWKLRNHLGQEFTARGRFNFVRQAGTLRVSKTGEHIHISRGNPVEYAGEVRFGYNRSNRGVIRKWSNASGHYQPLASLALQAVLPMDLFKPIDSL